MRGLTLTLVCAILGTGAAAANPIDGTWNFDFPCDVNATGVYGERCARGETDGFTLTLQARSGRLCGGYILTAQMTNHVDEDDLRGWTLRPGTRSHAYVIGFRFSGTTGSALVRLTDSRHLHWHVLREHRTGEDLGLSSWTFQPPKNAVLVRKPHAAGLRCTD